MLLVGGPGVSGQLLTITKPTGGTITSRGINCGTTGSDCSTTLPSGEPVELQTHADTGFMFTGYTGDCLSTGRTLMTSPRTCGGTFAPLPDVPAQVARLLTVTRPKGGTILSAGIQCGTLGSGLFRDPPGWRAGHALRTGRRGLHLPGLHGGMRRARPAAHERPAHVRRDVRPRAVLDAAQQRPGSPATPVPGRPPSGGGRDDASPPPRRTLRLLPRLLPSPLPRVPLPAAVLNDRSASPVRRLRRHPRLRRKSS